jgi:hypothetical protein
MALQDIGGFQRNLPFSQQDTSLALLNQQGGQGGLNVTTPFADMGAYGKIGTISAGLGAFSSLAQIYAGFKAMKLAKDQFKFQKEAFNKNYQAGVKDYENSLKDRWAARSASASARGSSFQSMETYVDARAIGGDSGGGT